MERTTRGTVTIDLEACKGCDLCIPACPPAVLRMVDEVNERGFRTPRLLSGCTGCGACALVCPDFCFEVYRFEGDEARGPVEVQQDGG